MRLRLMLGEKPEHEIVDVSALSRLQPNFIDDDARPQAILRRARPRRGVRSSKIPHDRLEHAGRHRQGNSGCTRRARGRLGS